VQFDACCCALMAPAASLRFYAALPAADTPPLRECSSASNTATWAPLVVAGSVCWQAACGAAGDAYAFTVRAL
jgi:hypothetical protein